VVGPGGRDFGDLAEDPTLGTTEASLARVDGAEVVKVADVGTDWLPFGEASILAEAPESLRGGLVDG
jgi:hypothetical protein